MSVSSPTIYCRHCRYALDGLPDARCPECGNPFDPGDPATFADRPGVRWHPAVKLAAALAAACVVAALVLRPPLVSVVSAMYLTLWSAFWAIVLWFGVWAYRRLRLRTLPWLGGYLAIRFAASFATPLLIHRMVLRWSPPFGWTLGETLAQLNLWRGALTQAEHLLVALLVLSEAANLISRDAAPAARPLRLLLGVRERPAPFGIVLMAVAALHLAVIAGLSSVLR